MLSASGLNPFPSADEGNRLTAGIRRPYLSISRCASGLYPPARAFGSDHWISTTMYCQPWESKVLRHVVGVAFDLCLGHGGAIAVPTVPAHRRAAGKRDCVRAGLRKRRDG